MPNAWVEHTRAFAKANGMSYGCAISDPKNKESYHAKKGGKADKPRQTKETAGMGAEDVDAPSDKVSSRIKNLMKDKDMLKVAERFLESSLSEKERKSGGAIRKLGVGFKEDYLDKPRAERIKMITPFLEWQAGIKEEKMKKKEDEKEKQKTLLTEVKTINVEPLSGDDGRWAFVDTAPRRRGTDAPVYGKIGGKWYNIGIKREGGGRGDMAWIPNRDAYFYVPKYVFINEDGVNITKKTRGIKGGTDMIDVERLEEMGVNMDKKKKK
jgi:hypothetical protein